MKLLRRIIFFVFIPLAIISAAVIYLYTPKKLDLTFDAAYYWSAKKVDSDNWCFLDFPTGHKGYLYIPEKYRKDKDNADAKLPLIVTFHGSMNTSDAVNFAKMFMKSDIQKKLYPEGVAVLAVFARIGYYTDPHSMSLLIQSILVQNLCIDPTNIIAYGHSQGAKYAVELACAEPRLFRGVISGSGFYHMTVKELLTVLPVSFYSATSENDLGIFEQAKPVGTLCARFCRDSRYVQYKTRGHLHVELTDKTGRGDETALDWLIHVINR